MKTLLHALAVVAVVLGLSACSTISTRINEKNAVYSTLDPNTQTKISHGQVDLGFTPDMVYMALGEPDMKRHRTTAQGTAEIWIYRTYYGSPADEFWGWYGWDWGPGPWGWGGGYYGRRAYYGGFYDRPWHSHRFYDHGWSRDDIRVTFQNGRVTMIDQPKS